MSLEEQSSRELEWGHRSPPLQEGWSKKNFAHYSPNSLLNIIYKIITQITTNRIAGELDENQPHEQAGFRKGFSTSGWLAG